MKKCIPYSLQFFSAFKYFILAFEHEITVFIFLLLTLIDHFEWYKSNRLNPTNFIDKYPLFSITKKYGRFNSSISNTILECIFAFSIRLKTHNMCLCITYRIAEHLNVSSVFTFIHWTCRSRALASGLKHHIE